MERRATYYFLVAVGGLLVTGTGVIFGSEAKINNITSKSPTKVEVNSSGGTGSPKLRGPEAKEEPEEEDEEGDTEEHEEG